MRSDPKISVVVASGDLVGESPVWCAEENALYWVDVVGRAIRKYDLSTARLQIWPTDDFPTAMTLRQSRPGALVSFATGLGMFDFETGQSRPFASPEAEMRGNRLNEGKADPEGRFWVGSMQTNLNSDGTMRDMDGSNGALYSVLPDATITRHSGFEYGISNTMAWDLDRGRFYFGDTLARTIYVFDYDRTAGTVSNRRVFAHTTEHGFPDGSCLDAHGFLWNCRYAGRCLLRYAPDGRIDRIVALPATNITACTFGGPDLGTLFVTTAANQIPEAARRVNPAEGALLAVDLGVTGAPEFRFGG